MGSIGKTPSGKPGKLAALVSSGLNRMYHCMHECRALLAGALVWKLIHCGNWVEHNLELIIPYTSWLFIESYFLKEGYEADQTNARIVTEHRALQTLKYRKGDCIASVILFEVRRRMTPLEIISRHDFTSFMCYLSPQGFVVPFPELTLL